MSEYRVYQDDAGEWRWKLVEANGRIIADSGEGYETRAGAERAVENVKAEAESAVVDDLHHHEVVSADET